ASTDTYTLPLHDALPIYFTEYPNDLPGYPRRLQEAGYETAYIGKWHMGEDNDAQRPGFDHWMSHRGQGNYFDNEFNINGERRLRSEEHTSELQSRENLVC